MKVLLWIWCLPQNLIGLFLSLFLKRTTAFNKRVYTWGWNCGLSLGEYIFVPSNPYEFVVKHEYGHNKQSHYLGPLYLLIIGLPSMLWCILHKFKPFSKLNYYNFYTEKWANKIAGYKVERVNGFLYVFDI